MTSVSLADVLHELRPNASWILDGSDYSGLQWLDEDHDQPSEQECSDKMLEMSEKYEIDLVRQNREAAYRMRCDPIFFKWQRGSATEQDWLDAVSAVKAEYPYPKKSKE